MTYDLLIQGGLVVDPLNQADPQQRDIWISAGKIVSPPTNPETRALRTIDALGEIVMPGGIDVHCHIAGSKVNAARAMRPEDHRDHVFRGGAGLRSGTIGSTPTTFATGCLYTALGYTTALDASIPPLTARHAHLEFADTPLIDKAFLVLMGNNHFLMDRIKAGEPQNVRDAVAWLLQAAQGYGVKVVNPGGVERWKDGAGAVVSLDDSIDAFDVTPRSILTSLARAIDELSLPHPMHLHGLNLGIPGNASTTLDTLQALDGHRVHLAHIQFHSYGEIEPKTSLFASRVQQLADYVNTHAGVTVDVGQVMFGETTSMTADGAVGHFLARLTGRKWVNIDVEMETGCGVVPITYSDKNHVHALQWAIGLEWFLRVEDPWRVALSTDHPNGGSFLTYPRIIALLMDRSLRADVFNSLPDKVKSRSGLGELTREYSLSEIAVITRAGPARMLGLAAKGHLAPGADADLTIYSPHSDKDRMFSMPRYVVKGGSVVVDAGEIRPGPLGSTLIVEPRYDPAIVPAIKAWIDRDYSIQFANYPVAPEDVANPRFIPIV